MKYIALIPLLITAVCPVFAANVVNDDNRSCNVDTLLTTSNPVELIADWAVNTINLGWYNNDERINVDASSESCKYGDPINVPALQPIHGYKFVKWRVRQPSAFDLSSLDIAIDGNAYYAIGDAGYAGRQCTALGDVEISGDSAELYRDDICPQSAMQDMVLFSWKTKFPYGTVKGNSKCSALSGNSGVGPANLWVNNTTYNTELSGNVLPETSMTDEEGVYCWCHATEYDAGNYGNFIAVASSPWVFYNKMDSMSCPKNCANFCGERLKISSGFRQAMFGIQ